MQQKKQKNNKLIQVGQNYKERLDIYECFSTRKKVVTTNFNKKLKREKELFNC